jgi:hypothetical protein
MLDMKLLKRFLREPLFHFVAVGALIFVFFVAINDTDRASADRIVITPERIDQLAAGFSSVWKRTPSEDELSALIDEDIREEVYYREAVALGLDKNDVIVRRRLRQKMEFLTDTGAYLLDPAAGELETYFVANEQAFREGPRVALEQIYLGKNPTPEAARRSLSALQSGREISPERTLLPAQLRLSPPNAVDDVFGKGFFDRVEKFPPEAWSGPVASAYGVHLVRILESVPARTPPLEEVRDAVLRDWKEAKAQEIREKDYAERREHFVIEIRRGDAQAAEDR